MFLSTWLPVIALLAINMGKKKGKRAEQPARDVCEDEPTPEDEEVVDQLEVMAVTGPADEQTEAESDLADLDNSAEGAPSMVVKGNETTRNLVVPYCPSECCHATHNVANTCCKYAMFGVPQFAPPRSNSANGAPSSQDVRRASRNTTSRASQMSAVRKSFLS